MRLITVMVLMFSMLLSGCHTMQAVEHSDWSTLKGKVEVGDTVEVVTMDGRTQKFAVTEVTPDALVGVDTRIAKEDISTLKVNQVHKGRTFGAAFGGAGVMIGVLFALATASLLGG
jgi:hypothetical protein